MNEIRIENDTLADAILAALDANEHRRQAVTTALEEGKDLPADCPGLVVVSRETEAFAGQIVERIGTLRTNSTDDTRKQMNAELQELRARKLLATHQHTVLDDI